jgi:hypothetical protein
MKTLVTITGGMDSAYLLWKLLTETSDEITAVNFDIGNTENRLFQKYDLRGFSRDDGNMDQSDKVIEVVTWLQNNVRPFTFVREPIKADYMSRDINFPNNVIGYTVRFAISKINSGEIDRLCLSSEWENDGFSHGGTIGKVRRPGSWSGYEAFVATATRGQIDFTLLDMDYNQAYALAQLPKPVIDIIRYPIRPTKFKNAKISWYKKQLNEGKTPAEAGAIAKAKCTLPNGKWFTMKSWVIGEEQNDLNTWDMPTWPTSYRVP